MERLEIDMERLEIEWRPAAASYRWHWTAPDGKGWSGYTWTAKGALRQARRFMRHWEIKTTRAAAATRSP